MVKAFLIGAGATKAQYPGAPLCKDFFSKLSSYDTSFFNHLEETIKPYINTSLIHSNIEEVMKLFYHFPPSIQTAYLDMINSAIYKVLVESTFIDEIYFHEYTFHNKIETPTIFRNLLNDNRLKKEDFFMTLNYDLYLDKEVLYTKKGIHYGIKTDFINMELISYSKNPYFSVYHLHGSLNWRIISDNKINLTDGPVKPSFNVDGSNICLVPPGKKELNPILKSVWEKAESSLLEADELIIIGCSLNPEDIELVNLMEKFVTQKEKDNVKIIYSTDDGYSSVENNYKKIIVDGYKKYNKGFNKYEAIDFIFE